MDPSRRQFLAGLVTAGFGAATMASAIPAAAGKLPSAAKHTTPTIDPSNSGANCPFRLAVINDEISQDFGHACEVASQKMGLHWIELRGLWNKSLADLDAAEIAEARRILEKNHLRVTDIASPLYKVAWPGAPLAKDGEPHDEFHADFDFKQQEQLLERTIELTKIFHTDRIRCFDFWRLEDQKPYRAAMNDKLREAAEKCAKSNVILVLENEMACNTATGVEAAAVLKAIPNKNFMLNWDPGNAAMAGATPYPDGYDLLPKDRIGHCHCKDVSVSPDGKRAWAPVGAGIVDWVGQFRALKKQGYRYAVSLETHWRGGGTAENSSLISMKGLKSTLRKAGIQC